MSNCIFNFNILAVIVSEIIGGPKFTLGGPAPPGRPLAENVSKAGTLPYLIDFFKFQLSISSSLEILAGPKFKIAGPAPP